MLALVIAFVITAGPLSTIQPGRIGAFVPAYATAIFVNDLITAVLLTFPGVFTPGGLLGAGLQTTNWLYVLWHAGFPLFVIAYVLSKDTDPSKGLWQSSAGAAILSSVAFTAALVCAATLSATAGDALLPPIVLDPVHFSNLWFYTAGSLALLCVVTLVVRRSVLDLWLMVVRSKRSTSSSAARARLSRWAKRWISSL